MNKRFNALNARRIRIIVDNSNEFQQHEGSLSQGTPTKVKIHNRTGARVLLDAQVDMNHIRHDLEAYGSIQVDTHVGVKWRASF